MILREASVDDRPQLVALQETVQRLHARGMPGRFRADASSDEMAEAIEEALEHNGSLWLVVEAEDGVLAGFLAAEFREREETWCMVAHQSCYLCGIVIADQFRRNGVARRLVEALSREAGDRGVDHIELDVWLFNEEARKAYESLGFTPILQRMRMPLRSDKPPEKPEPGL